ncbi:MAG: alpha/beta fold hydrolase [Xanthomonadales bacterium]|nr:alpha/beta fold hydrolase [Xanthomonadales bacterium]
MLAAILAGTFLLPVAQAAVPEGAELPPTTAPTRETPAAAPAPRTWRLGSLTFEACELQTRLSGASTAAWCNAFEVPENRADPSGRRIRLKLAVIRSDAGDAAKKDMVLMLAGGPGQAATESFANTAWYRSILKHRHVVLLDQRGTGGSHPLSCPETEKIARAEQADAADLDAGAIRAWTRRCLDEVRKEADPRYYTTTVAAEDLEDVRRALDSPQFNVLGVSYGTRMAQQYLMRHPDGVRSTVLDSPVPNQAILGEDFARNLESALDRQFAACTATPACKARFGDPKETLRALKATLATESRRVKFRDPQSFEEAEQVLGPATLAMVARIYAYTPETAALLPLTLDIAAAGDPGPLLAQAKLMSGDLLDDMNNGMSMSVICSEDADRLEPRPEDADTLLGNQLVEAILAQCEVWPHGARPADFHEPLSTAKPVLVLSGELDPVTPPAYGDVIMLGLANGRHLTLKGQGHALFARGCTPHLIDEFIARNDPAGLDASCLDRLGPTPAFINFNGAAP